MIDPVPVPTPPDPVVYLVVRDADDVITSSSTIPIAAPPDGHRLEEVTPEEARKLDQPGTKTLGSDGTITVTPPPPPPIVYDRAVSVRAQARTTDDVTVEVFRFPCELQHRYRASLAISAIDSVSFASKEMEGRFAWKRVTGNAVMIGGSGIVVVAQLQDAAASAWAPSALPSGTDVVFTVKGAVGRTIDWLLTGTVEVFAPAGLGAASIVSADAPPEG